jgi:hypothetical protein
MKKTMTIAIFFSGLSCAAPASARTRCEPISAESCEISQCDTFRKDIAIYSTCFGKVSWEELCTVSRGRWDRPKVVRIDRSRNVSATSGYWSTGEEASAEAKELLSKQGCR